MLAEEFKHKDIIVLTGGSGMFIDALCIGLDNIPSSSELRDTIQEEYNENGLAPLLIELQEKDPEYYAQVDRDNAMRIIRAIEAIRLTGKKYSEIRLAKPSPRPFEVHRFVINHEREILYDRINRRVDIMMDEGLLDEVKSVHHLRHLSSLNTVGYKEIFTYLDGHCSLDEAIEKIKQNTRRYAKRQLTWFRRHPEAHWLYFADTNEMVDEILSVFGERKNERSL